MLSKRDLTIFATGAVLLIGGVCWTVFADGGWSGAIVFISGVIVWSFMSRD